MAKELLQFDALNVAGNGRVRGRQDNANSVYKPIDFILYDIRTEGDLQVIFNDLHTGVTLPLLLNFCSRRSSYSNDQSLLSIPAS